MSRMERNAPSGEKVLPPGRRDQRSKHNHESQGRNVGSQSLNEKGNFYLGPPVKAVSDSGEQGNKNFHAGRSEQQHGSQEPLTDKNGGAQEPPKGPPYAGSADAEFPKEDPIKGFITLTSHLANLQKNAGGALFAAVVKKEDVISSPEREGELASFDDPSEKGALRFSQELTSIQYQDTLTAFGISFSNSVFAPRLTIANGRQFVTMLATIEEKSETFQKGVKGVVSASVDSIANAYIPDIFDEEKYAVFHLRPEFQLEVNTQGDAFKDYNQAVSQTVPQLHEIAKQLNRLDFDPQLVAELQTMDAAGAEGMLPEWAVAHSWGLFRLPTTDMLDLEWTQWSTPEDWQKLHDFLDKAKLKAPQNSQFLHNLSKGLLQGIRNVLNDEFVPSERPSFSSKIDPAVVATFEFDSIDNDPEIIALNEEYNRQYEALLQAAEKKLQGFLHTS